MVIRRDFVAFLPERNGEKFLKIQFSSRENLHLTFIYNIV